MFNGRLYFRVISEKQTTQIPEEKKKVKLYSGIAIVTRSLSFL